MSYVVIRHTIEDFDKWKAGFQAHQDGRKAAGEGDFKVFRGSDDPTVIVGVFQWDSVDNAKAFFGNPELAEKMKDAGVTGPPDILFMDQVI